MLNVYYPTSHSCQRSENKLVTNTGKYIKKSDVTIKSRPKSIFQNSLNTPVLCI